MSHTAILTGYHKDAIGSLCKTSARIGIDPEGVTEEDVELFRSTVLEDMSMDVPNIALIPTLLISIPGGKIPGGKQ